MYFRNGTVLDTLIGLRRVPGEEETSGCCIKLMCEELHDVRQMLSGWTSLRERDDGTCIRYEGAKKLIQNST